MRKIAIVALLFVSQSASAIPFSFDARTLGMGGVGVATADLGAASWANPAMMTRHGMHDEFSVLVGAGAFIRDDDDLIGDIEDYQDADDRRKDALDSGDNVALARALTDMRAAIRNTDDKVLAPELTLLFAIGRAFESFSMGLSVRADEIAGGLVTNLSCELTDPGCDPNELTNENFNILVLEGVRSTEFGLTFAKDFTWFDRRVSIGVKPKIVALDAFTYSESLSSIDVDIDIRNDEETDTSIGSFETVDLGLAIDLADNWLLGLNLRNLITDDFDVSGQTLNFDTEARIGVAYTHPWVTVGLDYDLTENEPLLIGDAFDNLTTQYIALGAEFRASDYAALRIGASKNLADDITGGARDIRYTAGVGFWFGFNLDLAFVLSDHSLGGTLQTGFRF